MAATIQLKRGLQSALSGASLAEGEIVFTTDTGMVYVNDGTNNQLIGRVEQGLLSARPTAGVSGRLYYATDDEKTYLDTGSAWVEVGITDLADMSGDLDDISDGTNYQRVAATEVDGSGYVTQINDGSNTVTASQARSHIDSTGNPHSTSIANIDSGTMANLNSALSDGTLGAGLNDSGTGSNDLWSADKVQTVVDNAISGLTWRDPVDETATAPTGNETGNDGWRVLINGTGTGDFSGHDNEIATWDDTGSSWSFQAPSANWALLDEATDAAYTYDADTTSWVQFSGAGQITAGVGLEKSGNTLSVLLGAGIGQLPTGEVGVEVSTTGGLDAGSASGDTLAIKPDSTTGATVAPITLSGNGAGVTVDDTTMTHTAGTLAIKDGGVDADAINATVAGDGLQGGSGTALAVDVSDFAGSGLEDDGSENLRIATTAAGDGLTGGGGSALSVSVGDFAGTGLEENGGDLRIAASAAGAGLTGGGGSALDVGAGNGITVAADSVAVQSDTTGGANLATVVDVNSNGVAVRIDDSSIKENGSNQLYVDTVDGGSL